MPNNKNNASNTRKVLQSPQKTMLTGDNGPPSNKNARDRYPIRDDIRAEREAQYILSNRMGKRMRHKSCI